MNKLCYVKVSVSKTVSVLSSQAISKHKLTKTARPHLCVSLGRLWGMALSELRWHSCISTTQNLCQASSHWDSQGSSSSLFMPLDWDRQVSCHKGITVSHFCTKICESPALSKEGIEIRGQNYDQVP